LFSPYGPIQEPFKGEVEEYINSAIEEREKPDRKEFRLGIEVNGKLIGGFVFDFIKKNIQGHGTNYETIGDVGVYAENKGIARIGWRYAVYPVMHFIKRVVQGYADKGKNLYISATTHQCNFETEKLLSTEKGFIELETRKIENYGPRRQFVCKYSDFVDKFLSHPRFRPSELKIKITNTLGEGGIN
jgi:hypothetical protein